MRGFPRACLQGLCCMRCKNQNKGSFTSSRSEAKVSKFSKDEAEFKLLAGSELQSRRGGERRSACVLFLTMRFATRFKRATLLVVFVLWWNVVKGSGLIRTHSMKHPNFLKILSEELEKCGDD